MYRPNSPASLTMDFMDNSLVQGMKNHEENLKN